MQGAVELRNPGYVLRATVALSSLQGKTNVVHATVRQLGVTLPINIFPHVLVTGDLKTKCALRT
eukprot:3750311-Karenia_brevis.AAC.1